MKQQGCAFCGGIGGTLIFQGPKFRVVRAAEPGFPAFYRLIWTDHVAEFSDLSQADRHSCMDAVTQLEQLLREHLEPTKVNLASLGNQVPHLHWHLFPRYLDDADRLHAVWLAVEQATGDEVWRRRMETGREERATTVANLRRALEEMGAPRA
jgi:diadenosine tetraphosphate (Ap4A) HIT family hydrolase